MGQPNREKIIGLKRALSSDVLAMAVMEIGEHCECDTTAVQYFNVIPKENVTPKSDWWTKQKKY